MSAPTMEKPASAKAPKVKDQPLFINGRFVDGRSAKTFATIDPATGKKLCDVVEASDEDVDDAGRLVRGHRAEDPEVGDGHHRHLGVGHGAHGRLDGRGGGTRRGHHVAPGWERARCCISASR